MDDDEVTVRDWAGTEIWARRMSVREFAEHLGASDRIVSRWEAMAAHPRPVNQAVLDTSLRTASAETRWRFAVHIAEYRGRDAER